ncbi:MAG: DivIVA domain-containing protein [Solobacterium sp.]|nr:DivIVA domain-containing protein [Solobacterium sp.]
MTSQRPTFRVMKNGYDRFAVDDAMERYASRIDQLEKKIVLYQDQLVETTKRLEELREKYRDLSDSMDAREKAASEIARVSIREANDIIRTAQQNADEIVREALISARIILVDLSKLYGSADDVKGELEGKLEALMKELEKFRLPQMPDLKWLEEAGNKLQ